MHNRIAPKTSPKPLLLAWVEREGEVGDVVVAGNACESPARTRRPSKMTEEEKNQGRGQRRVEPLTRLAPILPNQTLETGPLARNRGG